MAGKVRDRIHESAQLYQPFYLIKIAEGGFGDAGAYAPAESTRILAAQLLLNFIGFIFHNRR